MTDTRDICIQKVLSHQTTENPEIDEKLNKLYEKCSIELSNLLIEAATMLSHLTAVEIHDIFNVAMGINRLPTSFPLSCIGTELTSMYPEVVIASDRISTQIGLVNKRE